jgi:integrase
LPRQRRRASARAQSSRSGGAEAAPSSLALVRRDLELAKLGILPIGHVTFHGLRRTFASLRSYGGKSHRQTADLLGHEDVRFTLNVYAQSGLDPEEMLAPVRGAFDRALDWAGMGSSEPLTVPALRLEATKNPV